MSEEQPQAVTTPARKPAVQMTKAMWLEAEALWETGMYELADLSRKFGGIRRESLSRHFSKRGIVKGAKSVAPEVRKAVIDQAKDDIAKRANETRDEHYKWTRDVQRLMMARLAKAAKEGKPFAEALPDLKALETAQRILSGGLGDRMKLTGMDKGEHVGEEVEELVVRGLTEKEVEELRTQKDQVDEDLKDALDPIEETLEETEEIVEEGGGEPAPPPMPEGDPTGA